MSKTQRIDSGLVSLTPSGHAQIKDSPLMNDDLRPTAAEERTWTGYNIASLWIGMAVCIPTYTLASGLIAAGMNWWQAIFTIVLGNLIVLIPMILNAHAGTRYGIPYPVYARLWFGAKGAHIPAMLRAVVAAGWFGIQSWIGGSALDALVTSMWGAWASVPAHLPIAFLAFWGLNVWIGYRGLETIKFMEAWGAPVLIVLGLGLLFWAWSAAGGFGPMLSAPSKYKTLAEFLPVFFPSLTAMIAFWSTLALNIPDFTRYARSQRAQVWGQILGLPTTMGLYAFIGVAVTSATVVIFGKAIWDPVELMAKFPPLVVFLGTLGIVLATITTNIAANVVAPARSFENLSPRHITWGMGTIITGLIGIAMMPWYLLANFANYIFGWLGTYSAFLGPLDGIALADYWLVRKCLIDTKELYRPGGHYDYEGGINTKAVVALALGIVVALIGKFVPSLKILFDNAWAVGLLVTIVLYRALMRGHRTILSPEEFAAITEGERAAGTSSRSTAASAD